MLVKAKNFSREWLALAWEFNLVRKESHLLLGARQIPRAAARTLVKAYRYTFSALVGFHCRHLPTCSDYADQALERHGLWAGGWMTAARLCRCHPWGTSGLDFVPAELPPKARWYLPWLYGRWRGTNATPLRCESLEQKPTPGEHHGPGS
jgi:putative membrane protein insertion efficiency factor